MAWSPFRGRRELCASILTVCGLVLSGLLTSSPIRAASPDTAPPLPAPSGNIVTVSNVSQLQAAFSSLQSGQTIVINPGTYNLTGTLYVNGRSNVTVRGATNNRNDVVLVGKGMTVEGNVPFGIWTGQGANNVMIANLTIRDIYYHPIIINPGTTNPRIYNVRIVNAGQQFIKVNPDTANGIYVDNGIVEYSVMEYDTTSLNYYTNAVDVHGGDNWIIRHNLFRRIRAPQGELAGPAILMWRGAAGTVVEGNTFIDCHREIALGFEPGVSHSGGVIRNNFIYRTQGQFGDVGIAVWGSPNTKVVHNTIFMNGTYGNAIETRWDSTTGTQVVNNLSDRGIVARDGSQFSQQGNVWTATPGFFSLSVPGDLHLVPTATAAIDHGVSTSDAPLDWDGQARAGTRDVGADEYFAAAPPPPPPPPPTEICGNGIDDDHDGLIDEGCPGAPPPPPPPPVEVCGDGIDNDLDGQIDEGCAPPPAPAVPGAPSRLTGHVSGSTVSLSWLAPIVGTAPTGYVIEAGAAPGQTLISVPYAQTSLTAPGVGPGKYYLRVRAENASGASAPSNEVALTVGCSGASTGPRSLTSATSGQLISLKWVDPDGCSGSRYLLAVGSSPGAANLAIVPVDSPNVTVGAPAAVYYARVATQSDFGISPPSGEVQIVVGSSVCQTPTFGVNLSATVSGRNVLVAWNPASTSAALASDAIAPIQYALEVGTSAGAAALVFPIGRTTSLAIPAPPGDFYVRVRSFNVCGAGPASADQILRVR